jgi:hypothetical protein
LLPKRRSIAEVYNANYPTAYKESLTGDDLATAIKADTCRSDFIRQFRLELPLGVLLSFFSGS